MKQKYFKTIVLIICISFSYHNLYAQIEIPVAAHIVRKTDGTSPRVTSAQIDQEITLLTNAYSNMGITFTKCSENFVDDDFIWEQFDAGDDDNKLLLDNYTINNVVNVFFTDLKSGSHGRAVFPYKQKDWVIVDYNYIGDDNSTLPHEFGHYFGLFHTYSGVDTSNPASSSSLTIADAEGTEGWKYGDYLINTPLDPGTRSDYSSTDCSYMGSQTDNNGDTFHPDGRNYMGRGHGVCRDRFSEGQEKRIIEYIRRSRYYLECNSETTNNNLNCSNSSSITTFPHNDNFDRDDVEVEGTYWVQAREGDDMNWRNGPDTSSSSTGPDSAQDGQTFMYLEASLKYTSSDDAILLSPCYDFTDKNFANIEFYYHMHGRNTGSLELEISTDNGQNWTSLFFIEGEQHDSGSSPWTKKVIDLGDYVNNNVQFRFTAESIGSSKSDISIDNVTVNASGTVLSIEENNFVNLKLYPNPASSFITLDSPLQKIKNIEIYSTLGSLVYKSEVNLNTKKINISHLPKGFYLVKFFAENLKEAHMKLVKK